MHTSWYINLKGPRPFVENVLPLLCSLKRLFKLSVNPVYHLVSFFALDYIDVKHKPYL